jgi:hypothetical protein
VRRFLLIAFAAGALAAAAGCGGGGSGASGKSVSAESWAASVCAAVGGWSTDLQNEADSLSGSMDNATSVAEVRDTFVQFLENSVTRSDQMIDEAEAAGTPDVDQGGAIADDLIAELEKFRTALEDALAKAKDLPDDPAGFSQGAQEIGATMEQVGSDAESGIDAIQDKYDSEELTAAFDDAPACQEL